MSNEPPPIEDRDVDPGENDPPIRRHLLIAGSGRTGTSFLVRYLHQVGLDTHLARSGPNSSIDEAANAGLENIPLPVFGTDHPYVVKTPWAFEFIDELLRDPLIHIDGVIIPIRDLEEAASSRVILERRAIIERDSWRLNIQDGWRHTAMTPGGILASLEPLDQARILATGFHHLVQRLVSASIPIHMLAFPRLVTDADYLFDGLQGLLPADVDREVARQAHAGIADERKVRVGDELAAQSRPEVGVDTAQLERIALVREVERLKARADAAEMAHLSVSEALQRITARLAGVEAENGVHLEHLRLAAEQVARLRAENEDQAGLIGRLNGKIDDYVEEIARILS